MNPHRGSLFVDTAAWYSYVNEKDPDHEEVAEVLEAPGTTRVTSNYVFDETITLTAKKLGHEVALETGRALRDPPSRRSSGSREPTRRQPGTSSRSGTIRGTATLTAPLSY